VVASSWFERQEVLFTGEGSELAGKFKAVLESDVGRLYRARLYGSSPAVELRGRNVVAVRAKVFHPPRDGPVLGAPVISTGPSQGHNRTALGSQPYPPSSPPSSGTPSTDAGL